jgi:hypothetical protein
MASEDEAVFMAALAKFRETIRQHGLGVTVVFNCVVGAGGERVFTTDFREVIKNRRNAGQLRPAGSAS